MNGDKKLIYILVTLIIFLSIILLVKIKTPPKYNPIVYDKIYDEYEEIFGKNDINEIDENNMQNIEGNNIANGNNTHTTIEKTISNVEEQGNVIGQIIIPKIDIKYPIIRETTTEYLKVAPTKYCGPEVNEIRKFSCSRT